MPQIKPLLLISLALVTLVCLLNRASAATVNDNRFPLNGGWQFLPTSGVKPGPELTAPSKGWRNIKVPDNWWRQGYDIHGQAWYQTTFILPKAQENRLSQLVFQGVDYEADVWLNGHYLGHHTGYFQAFEFEASPHLKAGSNVLTVLVNSPLETEQDWSLHKRLIKGIFSHHDTRPGGAWSKRGQERNTGGIWAPVQLEFSDRVALRDLAVTPRKQETAPGQATRWNVETSAQLNLDKDVSHETPLQLETTISPENFSGKPLRFSQALKADGKDIKLSLPMTNPELWWPREYGKPNLYRLALSVKDAEGKVLDQREQVFGVREIKVNDGLQWHINGKRMFLRGTNYIASQWLAEMNSQRYAQDLRMMQQANINAVRVHAHVTGKAFYEACDRMGMLVTQDFPLLWGYSDSAEFIAEARSQAKDMLKSLNQHPSIISWTMHNESPWDSPWMAQKYPDYQPDINRQLDELLYADISKLETLRVVRKESATKEHEWMGWYFDNWQSFARPAPFPWSTEFGAQALPQLKSLRRMFTADVLWPDTEAKWQQWEYHNFQRKESFELAGIAQGKNIEEFIANTQAYQARLLQFAIENYRRQRYQPISAVFQFMFVENWPSINWGVVDYWREPKAGYAALKQAYQPIFPSLEWQQDEYQVGVSPKIGLWAINDTWQGFEHARYNVTLLHEGKRLDKLELPVEMLPDSGYKLRDYALPALQAGSYELQAEIVSREGKTMGRNLYRFTVK